MEKKRNMTKAGGIMAIVAYSVNILLLLYSAFALYIVIAALAGSNPDAETQAAIQVAIMSMLPVVLGALAISIVMIVLCSKLLKTTKLSPLDYSKKKGMIIFIIVILFLHGVVGLYQSFAELSEWTNYLNIVISLILIASGILITIDFAKNSKEASAQMVAEQQAKADEIAKANEETKAVSDESLEDKLEKLNNMKAEGLITEEEYDKMKADLLNK